MSDSTKEQTEGKLENKGLLGRLTAAQIQLFRAEFMRTKTTGNLRSVKTLHSTFQKNSQTGEKKRRANTGDRHSNRECQRNLRK